MTNTMRYIYDGEFGRIRVRVNKRVRRLIFSADSEGLRLTCHPNSSHEVILRALNELRPRLRGLVERGRASQPPTPEQVRELAARARQMLPQRLRELAERHGFTYNKVTLRNMRTRWGSCNVKGNISLNIHIVRLPVHLQDYVMLHELCHTREMNHSPRFWSLLDGLVGGMSTQYRADMRRLRLCQ